MPQNNGLAKQINALLAAGRAPDAARVIEGLLRKTPKNIPLWLMLAEVFARGMRRYDLTLKAAQKVIQHAPKDHRGWLEAAQALDQLERHEEARSHVDKARKLAPNDPKVILATALILANLDEIDKALPIMSRLVRKDPTNLQARIQLAVLMQRAGDLDAAHDLAHRIQQDHPDNVLVYSVIGATTPWRADDPALAYMENHLLPDLRAKGHAQLPELLMAAAKARNDLKDYDGSFALWSEAKQRKGRQYDAARFERFVTGMIAGTNRASYLGHPGSHDETPVLIVGMPRSGSTLLAQILVAHPQVASAGESPALTLLRTRMGLIRMDAPSQIKLIQGMTNDKRKAIADEYLAGLRGPGRTTSRIVDKRLHNFEDLGLLAAAMPKARIIHALRDPMDTCVACYMQKLTANHGYTSDLAGLGEYYNHYRKLMDHWAKVLPNPMITTRYEDVVADTEGKA
ncbi:MAG: sulfotransferase, partial [Octadecabacter sp.]|nr:sulfotransferase [Octadecabacter sp.]